MKGIRAALAAPLIAAGALAAFASPAMSAPATDLPDGLNVAGTVAGDNVAVVLSSGCGDATAVLGSLVPAANSIDCSATSINGDGNNGRG
ncbi:MAG: hypothetical protein JWQ81_5910 [Amycolatopsis sp.]|uniref:hypothetical protein n=1 Tax=Amycolatopsis sp. TaxID=37632 RepID=UPI00260AB80F|nr:hypothetical protein [Amycolatopsis sp.]MCU1685171.1 hypothetical protein [Amycolatopsis sp.]